MIKVSILKAATAALIIAAGTFSSVQADDIEFLPSSHADFGWVDFASNNQVIAIQNGNDNEIKISQTNGASQHLKVHQKGSGNLFDISHSGSATLLAEQFGNGNSTTGNLRRDNQYIAIRQNSNNMHVSVTGL